MNHWPPRSGNPTVWIELPSHPGLLDGCTYGSYTSGFSSILSLFPSCWPTIYRTDRGPSARACGAHFRMTRGRVNGLRRECEASPIHSQNETRGLQLWAINPLFSGGGAGLICSAASYTTAGARALRSDLITNSEKRSISSSCGLNCNSSRSTPASSNSAIRSATCSGVPTRPERSPRFETE